MMRASDEKTLLTKDFTAKDMDPAIEDEDTNVEFDMNEAIETAGFGWGTILHSLGPFLLYCLEGGEIIVLSIVGIMLRCEWNLSTFWVAFLQMDVLIGMGLASLVLSGAGDTHGRKPIALTAAIGVTISGLLSGLATKYWHLASLRGLLGAFIGVGMGPCVAMTAEISTVKTRGFLVSYICLAWGIGASMTSALAYFVLDPYGWRGLMIGTALMFSPSILLLSIMGESPRFDAKKGNWASAEATVRTIAKLNCTAGSQSIRLKREEENVENSTKEIGHWGALNYIKEAGRLKDFSVIMTLGLAVSFVYYFISYSMPRFLNEGYCSDEKVTLEQSCVFEKSVLFDLGVISLFEPLGVVIAVIMMEFIGRKKTFQSSFVLLTVAITALYLCVSKTYSIVFLILTKFSVAQIGYSPFILGSEYFPTEVRSFTAAAALGVGKVGALVGMGCSQFVFELNPRLVLLATQVGALVVSICLWALRKETVGTNIE